MKRRPYSRSGLHTLKRLVKTHGLNALDHRSAPVRALWGWRLELLAALGGERVVTPQQQALVDMAVRTRLYVDHVDAFLIAQRSLINKKRKAVLPVLRERQALADGLARLLGMLGLERRIVTLDLAQALRAHDAPSTALVSANEGHGGAVDGRARAGARVSAKQGRGGAADGQGERPAPPRTAAALEAKYGPLRSIARVVEQRQHSKQVELECTHVKTVSLHANHARCATCVPRAEAPANHTIEREHARTADDAAMDNKSARDAAERGAQARA